MIEAAAIDGARPAPPLLDDRLSAAVADRFFLLVVNIVYAFFDTFGIIHAVTGGGRPRRPRPWSTRSATTAALGGDLGGSAAQSVILMAIVIALTAIQFRYVERRVTLR